MELTDYASARQAKYRRQAKEWKSNARELTNLGLVHAATAAVAEARKYAQWARNVRSTKWSTRADQWLLKTEPKGKHPLG